MMAETAILEHFDSLFFTESTFGKPVASGSSISVPIKGVMPINGHPRLSEGRALAGRLLFKGVEKSTRTVTEYIGDPRHPDGFKEPYIVEDGGLSNGTIGTAREYAFEGVQEEPRAWVDWVVRASSFEFIVEDVAANPS